MIVRGHVKDGVVVLEPGVKLPEGALVEIVFDEEPAAHGPAPTDILSADEHQRIRDTIEQIASLPIEGPSDEFSGADHDRVLYGQGR
ncbi:MAG: hypothetical protein HYS13_00010 [Planctomycetia bacterium]|nr:hypothetical protein [Planctomycetia bacterium]